ncbi:MAG: ABC-F family ATP-binding cassette domain-containing protein [Firmicutes bacterium]|nr:ABC-F family ATP-binding cassette domain-containing protein [Bacillota bacterium]
MSLPSPPPWVYLRHSKTVHFVLVETNRVGLVGANGSGKSALMKMLANAALSPADPNGALYVTPHVRVAYLPQDFQPVEMQTVDGWLASAQRELLEMERQMGDLAATMAKWSSTSRNSPDAAQQLEQAMVRYGELATRFEQRGGYERTARTEAVLQGLGLSDIPQDRPMATLSGGEQVRLGLAAVLLQSPDLLLLDEPTNHLDLAVLEWLEHYLAATPKTILVASHDRLFLNRTVTRILEIDESDHHIRSFLGNYDAYLEEKRLRRRSWGKKFEEQQEQIHLLRQRVAEANRQVGLQTPWGESRGYHRP